MENEKNNFDLEQETTEVLDEVTEEAMEAPEVLEDVVEAVEEVATEEVEEVAQEEPQKKTLSKVYVCDECGLVCEDAFCGNCQKELTDEYVCTPADIVAKAKKRNKSVWTAAIAVVAVVVVAFVAKFLYLEVYNPYNHDKENKFLAYGNTLAEAADDAGYSYKTYLELNKIPSNMPKSTYEGVANMYITVQSIAENYGMDAKSYIEALGVEGDFGDDATVAEVQDEMTIDVAFGVTEENLPEFLEFYGLDDSVTLETKFKEIKEQFLKAQYDKYLEQEKASEDKDADEAEDIEDLVEAAEEAQDAE